MTDRPMTNREHALMAYLATVAGDPRVRLARGAEAVLSGVFACLREDLPAAGFRLGFGALDFARVRLRDAALGAASEAGGLAVGVVDDLAQKLGTWIDDVLGGGRTSAKR